MNTTLRRLVREGRVRYAIIGVAMAAWFTLMLVVTRGAAAEITAKAEIFDSALTRGFGLGALVNADAILAQMVGVSFNHPIVLALIGAVTVAPGARACQGELRDGTLDMTLARSISRTRYLSAYVVLITCITAVLMLIAFATIVGSHRLFDVPGQLDLGRAALMCVNAFVVFLTFGAIALLVSVLLGRRGNATFATIGVLAVMFAITFAERAWSTDLLELLAPISVFHWLDPTATLTGVDLRPSQLLVPIVLSAICVAVALWRFERRDL